LLNCSEKNATIKKFGLWNVYRSEFGCPVGRYETFHDFETPWWFEIRHRKEGEQGLRFYSVNKFEMMSAKLNETTFFAAYDGHAGDSFNLQVGLVPSWSPSKFWVRTPGLPRYNGTDRMSIGHCISMLTRDGAPQSQIKALLSHFKNDDLWVSMTKAGRNVTVTSRHSSFGYGVPTGDNIFTRVNAIQLKALRQLITHDTENWGKCKDFCSHEDFASEAICREHLDKIEHDEEEVGPVIRTTKDELNYLAQPCTIRFRFSQVSRRLTSIEILTPARSQKIKLLTTLNRQAIDDVLTCYRANWGQHKTEHLALFNAPSTSRLIPSLRPIERLAICWSCGSGNEEEFERCGTCGKSQLEIDEDFLRVREGVKVLTKPKEDVLNAHCQHRLGVAEPYDYPMIKVSKFLKGDNWSPVLYLMINGVKTRHVWDGLRLENNGEKIEGENDVQLWNDGTRLHRLTPPEGGRAWFYNRTEIARPLYGLPPRAIDRLNDEEREIVEGLIAEWKRTKKGGTFFEIPYWFHPECCVSDDEKGEDCLVVGEFGNYNIVCWYWRPQRIAFYPPCLSLNHKRHTHLQTDIWDFPVVQGSPHRMSLPDHHHVHVTEPGDWAAIVIPPRRIIQRNSEYERLRIGNVRHKHNYRPRTPIADPFYKWTESNTLVFEPLARRIPVIEIPDDGGKTLLWKMYPDLFFCPWHEHHHDYHLRSHELTLHAWQVKRKLPLMAPSESKWFDARSVGCIEWENETARSFHYVNKQEQRDSRMAAKMEIFKDFRNFVRRALDLWEQEFGEKVQVPAETVHCLRCGASTGLGLNGLFEVVNGTCGCGNVMSVRILEPPAPGETHTSKEYSELRIPDSFVVSTVAPVIKRQKEETGRFRPNYNGLLPIIKTAIFFASLPFAEAALDKITDVIISPTTDLIVSTARHVLENASTTGSEVIGKMFKANEFVRIANQTFINTQNVMKVTNIVINGDNNNIVMPTVEKKVEEIVGIVGDKVEDFPSIINFFSKIINCPYLIIMHVCEFILTVSPVNRYLTFPLLILLLLFAFFFCMCWGAFLYFSKQPGFTYPLANNPNNLYTEGDTIESDPDPFDVTPLSQRFLIVTCGTRGDHVPMTFYGRLAATLGVRTHVYNVHTATHQELAELKQGNFSSWIPSWLTLTGVTNQGYGFAFVPHVPVSGNAQNYYLGGTRKWVEETRYGTNWLSSFVTWVSTTYRPQWSIGALTDNNLPRSADGLRPLTPARSYNEGSLVGWLSGSADEINIPEAIRKNFPRIVCTDHANEFKKYRTIFMHGGKGTVDTALCAGVRNIEILDKSMDRIYHTMPTPMDTANHSVLPFIGALIVHGIPVQKPFWYKAACVFGYYRKQYSSVLWNLTEGFARSWIVWQFAIQWYNVALIAMFSLPWLYAVVQTREVKKYAKVTLEWFWRFPIFILLPPKWLYVAGFYLITNAIPKICGELGSIGRHTVLRITPVKGMPMPFGHTQLVNKRTGEVFEGGHIDRDGFGERFKFLSRTALVPGRSRLWQKNHTANIFITLSLFVISSTVLVTNFVMPFTFLLMPFWAIWIICGLIIFECYGRPVEEQVM
jgi:hypothetical protein